MKWVNFLHIYQPPTQTKEIVELVTRESYEKIIELLNTFPNLKLTMNISGSLLELWERDKKFELISAYAKYAAEGRIELVSSAMYHPILPLISETEIKKQISMHNEISVRLLGPGYAPKGFYVPEMAYSPEVGRIIKSLGYEWVLLDEIHAGSEIVDPAIHYTIENIGLTAIFRNRTISKHFPPEAIESSPEYANKPYIISAHDGELYGHWHKDDHGYYKKAFTDENISLLTVSEYLNELQNKKEIGIVSASWESLPAELTAGVPFALWNDPNNPYHEKLWGLARYAISSINTNLHDSNILEATTKLHRGLASCAWWWATERKLGPFSPETWNPTEIEKGAEELLSAIRSLKDVDPATHITGEKLFSDLRDTVWEHHWERTPQTH